MKIRIDKYNFESLGAVERERERERATLYLTCNLINYMDKKNLVNKIEIRQIDLWKDRSICLAFV